MAILPLWNKDGQVVAHVLIDDQDAPLCASFRLYLSKVGYAAVNIDGKQSYLHRLIMNNPAGMQIDHRNRDRLDCRRENLRIVTDAENKQNVPARRGFRGLSFERGHWRARFGSVYIGWFLSEEEAAQAVTAWRRQHLPYSIEEA